MSGPEKQGQDQFRSAVTTTVIWVAGLTLVIIFGSLAIGILLDKYLNSKPIFTIVLMVGSIPVTILMTLRVVRSATRRIQPGAIKKNPEEVSHRGEDS